MKKKYTHESHLRSLLKGISWRFVATSDTILIVLLVTCLTGHCSIENALKIGAAEFLIKLFIYYVHERIWDYFRTEQTISNRQTLYKTFTWRFVATTTTFLISGVVLEGFNEVAFSIAILEVISKLVLYYLHEKLWQRLPLGRIRNYFLRKLNLKR